MMAKVSATGQQPYRVDFKVVEHSESELRWGVVATLFKNNNQYRSEIDTGLADRIYYCEGTKRNEICCGLDQATASAYLQKIADLPYRTVEINDKDVFILTPEIIGENDPIILDDLTSL